MYFLKDKFYDQLRTKETLGYIVELSLVVASGYYCLINICML